MPSLAEVAITNLVNDGVSPLKAGIKMGRVMATVWALAVAAESLGDWPSQVEYAAYWKVSERSAQREWEAFREAFPGEESPDRLARHLRSQVIGSRLKSEPAAAYGLPFPQDLVAA